MARKVKKLSAREKQIRRIKQAIRRNAKQGYILDYSTLEGYNTRRLKNITPSKLREMSEHRVEIYDGKHVDVVTGEVIKEERSGHKLLNKELEEQRQKFEEQMENVSRETFEQPSAETIAPTNYNVLERIEELIEDIPRALGVFNSRERKFESEWYWENDFPLMQVFISSLKENDEQDVIEYYTMHEYELAVLLTVWQRASEKEDIEQGFTFAMLILNMGNALSSEQASALASYFES